MKNRALFFYLIALLLTSSVSYAQNSILQGKIVDENDKAIAGATIKVSKQGVVLENTRSDNDGLYYTKLLREGTYHIDVVANGKYLEAKKLYFYAIPGHKKYYIIRVLDEKVVIEKVDEDPGTAMKLSKIGNGDWRNTMLFGPRTGAYYLNKDSASGKLTPAYGSGMAVPHVSEAK